MGELSDSFFFSMHISTCTHIFQIFADGTHVATFCGNQKPDMLTLPAYSTIVKFVSDSIYSRRGFNITYRSKGAG